MTITAIVPAYNEEKNIPAVLRALKQSTLLSEIIVVDDGSRDATAEVAEREGVRVISQENQGKAGAMRAGAHAANADILFFADADLVGFTADHVNAVITPVLSGSAGMSVGIRGWGRIPLWVMRQCVPVIGGERAIMRSHFLHAAQHRAASRYGIETVMNAYCRRSRIPVILVRMPGVSLIRKEQKVGLLRGMGERMRMFGQIMKAEIAVMIDRT